MSSKDANRRKYEQYIHSPEWRAKANRRLEQDHHVCCVCGRPATEVHHLTYDHFGDEIPEDLVSLCHQCHCKAEEIYDPAVIPWAMEEKKPEGNNFMAAMRVDARKLAPVVFDYLEDVRGSDFDSLMSLRQPDDPDGKNYWGPLKKAVNALCRKRYSRNCAADRMDLMLTALTDQAEEICLAEIEHYIRNSVQGELHADVMRKRDERGNWKAAGESLGIGSSTLRRLRSDEGISFGPALREEVLHCCGHAAADGIRPLEGFSCLSDTDYERLNAFADFIAGVSGDGAFKGEVSA